MLKCLGEIFKNQPTFFFSQFFVCSQAALNDVATPIRFLALAPVSSLLLERGLSWFGSRGVSQYLTFLKVGNKGANRNTAHDVIPEWVVALEEI